MGWWGQFQIYVEEHHGHPAPVYCATPQALLQPWGPPEASFFLLSHCFCLFIFCYCGKINTFTSLIGFQCAVQQH